MATILIVYGNSDEDAADVLQRRLESISSHSVVKTDGYGTDSVNYGEFGGVLVVGAANSNNIWQDLQERFGWSQPVDSGDLITTGEEYVVTDLQHVSGTPVQGLAGYTGEDTVELVKVWSGAADIQLPIESPAGIDDFVDAVNAASGGSEDPVSDPYDPIVTDPEEPQPEPEPIPDMPVEVRVEATGASVPGTQDYSMTVDGHVSSRELQEDRSVYKNSGTVSGAVGGGDVDVWVMSEDALITDFEAEKDKRLFVDGSKYRYDATTDRIDEQLSLIRPSGKGSDNIADSEKTDETIQQEKERKKEENESFWEAYADALKNPAGSPENLLMIGTLILALLVLKELAGIGENLS